MNVILLGEPLAEWSLQCAEIGDSELEDLRRLLAGYEERRLWVLVLLRLALRHCALCAGILRFSGFDVNDRIPFPNARLSVYIHLFQHLVVVL
jgi:hypothetical protein